MVKYLPSTYEVLDLIPRIQKNGAQKNGIHYQLCKNEKQRFVHLSMDRLPLWKSFKMLVTVVDGQGSGKGGRLVFFPLVYSFFFFLYTLTHLNFLIMCMYNLILKFLLSE